MKTSYIYSASRVKALEKELLNEFDVERLLEAKKSVDLIKTLKEISAFSHIEADNVDGVLKSLDQILVEAKKVITRITPQSNVFDFVWIYYDLQNLRVQIKSRYANLSTEEVVGYMTELGKYSPSTIIQHINDNTLQRLEPEFKIIYEEAGKMIVEKGVFEADRVIEQGYFNLAKRLAFETRDLSINNFLRIQIDLYNLKTRLRTLIVSRGLDSSSWFVTGGNLRLENIESKEQAISALFDFGGEDRWRKAVDLYQSKGHSTLLDVGVDDYLLETAKIMGYDTFSPASLLYYFFKVQSNIKVIKTILVGKETNQSESDIKERLRKI